MVALAKAMEAVVDVVVVVGAEAEAEVVVAVDVVAVAVVGGVEVAVAHSGEASQQLLT